MPPQQQKQRHRLTTAESILPFFHLCRWRRGVQGRRTRTREAGCRRAHITPSGGKRRRCIKSKYDAQVPPQPSKMNQSGRISSRWRVSRAYILSQNHTRSRICDDIKQKSNKYIGSKQQRERIQNCIQMYRYISHIKSRHKRSETGHTRDTESWDSISRPSWLNQSSKNPVRTRGRRPGRPAGPGLPHGDQTGDDD